MSQVAFDTLEYFEKLKNVGVPENQARAQVEVMQGILKNHDFASRKNMASKKDIQDILNEIQAARNEAQKEFHAIRNEFQKEIQNVKNEINTFQSEIQKEFQNVRSEISDVRSELQKDIQNVRNEISDAKHETLKWMVTGMLAQTALLIGIIAFLK